MFSQNQYRPNVALSPSSPGTLLLNPEGFEHAPGSADGCLLLVRLRQYPGERPQLAVDSNKLPWEGLTDAPGVERKLLFKHATVPDTYELQRSVRAFITTTRLVCG